MLPIERIAYSAIKDRPRLALPGGARLVVWVIINIEERVHGRRCLGLSSLRPPAVRQRRIFRTGHGTNTEIALAFGDCLKSWIVSRFLPFWQSTARPSQLMSPSRVPRWNGDGNSWVMV